MRLLGGVLSAFDRVVMLLPVTLGCVRSAGVEVSVKVRGCRVGVEAP